MEFYKVHLFGNENSYFDNIIEKDGELLKANTCCYANQDGELYDLVTGLHVSFRPIVKHKSDISFVSRQSISASLAEGIRGNITNNKDNLDRYQKAMIDLQDYLAESMHHLDKKYARIKK